MEVTYIVSMCFLLRLTDEYRSLYIQIEKKEGSAYALIQIDQLLN